MNVYASRLRAMRPLQHRGGGQGAPSLDIRAEQLIHSFQLESHAIVAAAVGLCGRYSLVGPGRSCSPRHVIAFDSIIQGPQCGG
jgi:hypothetical protein